MFLKSNIGVAIYRACIEDYFASSGIADDDIKNITSKIDNHAQQLANKMHERYAHEQKASDARDRKPFEEVPNL